MRAWGKPTHTAATSCGVNPTNHASLHCWAVPVFPAAGRSSFAAVPVPDWMTSWRIRSAVHATEGVMTSSRFGSASYMTSPRPSMISLTAVGGVEDGPRTDLHDDLRVDRVDRMDGGLLQGLRAPAAPVVVVDGPHGRA